MMRTPLLAGLIGLLGLHSTLVQAAPPTDASVEKLLEITKAESMVESSLGSMEQMVRQGMTQAAAGKELTAEQKRTLEIAPRRIVDVLREQMNWATMKPIYVSIYKESFEQADIDGLIAFYQSPTGQTFVAKMPVVMQKSMTAMQAQMQQFVPKLRAAMEEALKDAQLTR